MTTIKAWRAAYILFLLVVSAIASPAQVFTTIVNLDGTNGSSPYAAFAQGMDGNLYGTTGAGGINNAGTVFKIAPNGKLTTLYNFCSQPNCTDGLYPEAGLVLGTDRNFYGTTTVGGDVPCPANGCGTLFTINPAGKLTTIYNFCRQTDCTDGEQPAAALVQASNGNFYGTTPDGGGTGCGGWGCGVVFEITPMGSLTTLHIFNHADGAKPDGPLIQATDGNLYGTTFSGGPSGDHGTAFKITLHGTLATVHAFASGHGTPPIAGLLQASDGNFYGTTLGGSSGNGTIFKLTPSGSLTTLHDFNATDGNQSSAPLIQGTDGALYGTTIFGGDLSCHFPFGCGTVFRITLDGTLTTLHNFAYSDGANPYAGLVQATNGTFYGTTTFGGTNNDGTIFSLDLGLGPFVTFVRAAGKVGQTGGILGQGFTGTTSVSLNGVPASFTVRSDTYITATVPAGATTGYVTVVSPSGTLTSNVPLHVIR